jgi:hypothetical protein
VNILKSSLEIILLYLIVFLGLYVSILPGQANLSPELSKVMYAVIYDYMTKLINEPFDGDKTHPVSVNKKVLGLIAKA